MGFIHVDVDVSNPGNSDLRESVQLLVDTGAMLSVLPSSVLDKLDIRRMQRRRFVGFGGVVARDIGTVDMTYMGVQAGVTVIFGAEGDPLVMGVTALEVLGFEVDPVNGKLNQLDLIVM